MKYICKCEQCKKKFEHWTIYREPKIRFCPVCLSGAHCSLDKLRTRNREHARRMKDGKPADKESQQDERMGC